MIVSQLLSRTTIVSLFLLFIFRMDDTHYDDFVVYGKQRPDRPKVMNVHNINDNYSKNNVTRKNWDHNTNALNTTIIASPNVKKTKTKKKRKMSQRQRQQQLPRIDPQLSSSSSAFVSSNPLPTFIPSTTTATTAIHNDSNNYNNNGNIIIAKRKKKKKKKKLYHEKTKTNKKQQRQQHAIIHPNMMIVSKSIEEATTTEINRKKKIKQSISTIKGKTRKRNNSSIDNIRGTDLHSASNNSNANYIDDNNNITHRDKISNNDNNTYDNNNNIREQSIYGANHSYCSNIKENNEVHANNNNDIDDGDDDDMLPLSLLLKEDDGNVLVSPWVRRFLDTTVRHNHDYLLPIPNDFCIDNFNLIQLPSIIELIGRYYYHFFNNNKHDGTTEKNDFRVHHGEDRYSIYRQALQLIVDDHPPLFAVSSASNNNNNSLYDYYEHIPQHVNKAAIALYLLIHQRYVLSPRGLEALRRKFLLQKRSATTTRTKHAPSTTAAAVADEGDRQTNDPIGGGIFVVNPIFGRCPRQRCYGMPLLPIGDSDTYSYNDKEDEYSSLLEKTDNNNQNTNQHEQEETIKRARAETTADAELDNNRYNNDDNHNDADSYYNNNKEDNNWSDIAGIGDAYCNKIVTKHDLYVKRYCACCNEIFYNWDSKIDGCAWGASFCHLFILLYGKELFHPWIELINENTKIRNNFKVVTDTSNDNYTPRIFGFKLHPSAMLSFED